MVNHDEIASAVMNVWLLTGEVVTRADIESHLDVPVLATLNACGWEIPGTMYGYRNGLAGLQPTMESLRAHILDLQRKARVAKCG